MGESIVVVVFLGGGLSANLWVRGGMKKRETEREFRLGQSKWLSAIDHGIDIGWWDYDYLCLGLVFSSRDDRCVSMW